MQYLGMIRDGHWRGFETNVVSACSERSGPSCPEDTQRQQSPLIPLSSIHHLETPTTRELILPNVTIRKLMSALQSRHLHTNL